MSVTPACGLTKVGIIGDNADVSRGSTFEETFCARPVKYIVRLDNKLFSVANETHWDGPGGDL